MNCLLHKQTDCCTIIVKTSIELKKRLEHIIRLNEIKIPFTLDRDEREKLVKQRDDYGVWVESL